MNTRWIIWSFVGLISIFRAKAVKEDIPIGFYSYVSDDQTLSLYTDLTSLKKDDIASIHLEIQEDETSSAINIEFDGISTLVDNQRQNIQFKFNDLSDYEGKDNNLILKITKTGTPLVELITIAHFKLDNTLPSTQPVVKLYETEVLGISDTKITSTFDETLFEETDVVADTIDGTNYIISTYTDKSEVYLCIKDTTADVLERGKALPHCYATPVTLDSLSCKIDMDLITVNRNEGVVTGTSSAYTEDSAMVLKGFSPPVCETWNSGGCTEASDFTAIETFEYYFIDNAADVENACAKGTFNVIEINTAEIDGEFLEVEWSLNQNFIGPLDEHKYIVEFVNEDATPRTYNVDCTGAGIVYCDVYYFPGSADHLLASVTQVTLAFEKSTTKKNIRNQPFTNRKSGTKAMDIVSANFSNRKNSEVCVFDKLMPNTNSSEFIYELVVANSEGSWKKYSSYTKKDQSLCFFIQLPADKFMPNSQIHLAAIKRDVKQRSISSSSYVKSFLAEPKVKLLNADVAKVELEGVGHIFLIKDAATHKIITRDVQKKGLEAYIRVDQKNGGVSNKEFILEMRDGRMVSRVQFKTPEYKAVSE